MFGRTVKCIYTGQLDDYEVHRYDETEHNTDNEQNNTENKPKMTKHQKKTQQK